jgi:hypothetical protein
MGLSRQQKNYVENAVVTAGIRNQISGKGEGEFKKILERCGYKEGEDFIHQFPCSQEEDGLIAIADFAFPNEKLIIEIDGDSHKTKPQIKKDARRDQIFQSNDFHVIRITLPLTDEKKSYWSVYVKTLIKDAREDKNN